MFNPVTASTPLTLMELLAGPIGLIAFLPLIPLARLLAPRGRAGAIALTGVLWIFASAGPAATAVLLGWLLVTIGYLVGLHRLRAADRLSRRGMIAAIWIGLTLLIAPLWWRSQWGWYGWEPSRMAALHNLGFAYFYLRFISWGVDWAGKPDSPLRLGETLAWLLYPPCMRLGPVLPRETFFERLAAWAPAAAIPWREVGRRFGLFILGGVLLMVLNNNTPHTPPGGESFFAAPEKYSTTALIRAFYNVPIGVYLILWTYNELAAVAGLLCGIRVDNNFDWLPAADSVRDFWRRWHVTVGGWLRTYIYFPLGGNRGFVPLNFMAVFVFCAVWHGPSWSFLVWGVAQALALIVQRGWDRLLGRDRKSENAPRPANPAWRSVCWLLTMHFQALTILAFTDFDHSLTRFVPELWRRLVS